MWLSFEHDIRENVKNNILAALTSPKDSIRKRAAELIAYIYPVEHKHNRWENLIPMLSDNMEHSEMEKSDTITLSSETLRSLLKGIYSGLSDMESVDIQTMAFSALESSLKFTKEIFQDQNVMHHVCRAIIQPIMSDNELVKIQVLERVVKFVEIYPIYSQEWIQMIAQVTQIFAKSTEPELVMAVIKIWTAIFTEGAKIRNSSSVELYPSFNEQNLNIILSAVMGLIPFLMHNLLDAKKYEDLDFEEAEFGDTETSTINNCTKTCLERAAAIVGMEPFVHFVSGNLKSDDDVKRRAALIAYSCVLSGFNDKCVSIIPALRNEFPRLRMLLMESKRFCMKVAAAEALGKTAQVVPDIFLSNDTGFAPLSAELVKYLESHPLVSRHIAKAWRYIGEEIAAKSENKSENESKFDIDFDRIIKALITNASREDIDDIHHPLIEDSLLAAKFLIEANDISKHIPLLLKQLQLSKDIGYDERRMHIQSEFSSCLQAVIRKHQFEGFDSIAKESLQLAIDLIETGNKPAGFRIIGALASSLRSDSEEFFDKAWLHIETALQLYAQQDAFDAASECVSDWARACPQKIIDHLENILKNYLNSVNGDTCNNEARISVLTGITGIIIGCQEQIVPHVNKIGQIYGSLISTASKWSNKGDSDSLKILREKLLDSYSEFFRVITQSSDSEAIFDFLPQVIKYLFRTSEREYNPTANYGRAILSFVVDVVSMFGEKAKEHLNPYLIIGLMDALKNVKYPEESKDFKENKSALAHATQVVFEVFKDANFNGF